MSATVEPPSNRKPLKWPSEDFWLTSAFRLLVIATVGFLSYDFYRLSERGDEPSPGINKSGPTTFIVKPTTDSDQVRPYLPRAMPMRGRGTGPKLPGYAKPPSSKRIAEPMIFLRGPKGAVSAVGRIEPGTADAFKQFLDGQGGEVKSVYLHSPGGAVRDGLAMSNLIRRRKLETVVPDNAYCASSCPIVLAGGTVRRVGRKAWVGVHQVFAVGDQRGNLGDGLAEGQKISASVQQHLVDMGVSAEAWLPAMRTPSTQLYVFRPAELRRLKLATSLGGS